ncbi:HAAS signaling domain-containing protein [Actinocorallia longicatena]|uniref:Proline-rich protein n=1 Tax=Actinocorallia longicatena TaxID=111803 RepID=A0ABP6Q240_9ACTN
MIATPVTEYAAAVRAALADVPAADRAELLEDLEEHLAEIDAESGESLEARLGPPERYAAELRAAYTDVAVEKPRVTAWALFDRTEAGIAEFFEQRVPEHPGVRAALRDARPMWWLLRGYLTAYVFWAIIAGEDRGPLPDDPGEFLCVLLFAGASVWLGQRARSGSPRRRPIALVTALFSAFAIWAGLVFLSTVDLAGGASYYPQSYAEDPVESRFGGTINIYPFKDGKPLTDVQLYDQDGNPVNSPPLEEYPMIPGSRPVAANVYPKPLCYQTDEDAPMDAVLRLMPVCPQTPEVGPVPDATAPPAEQSPSPTTKPTAKPTASPTPSPTGRS